MAVTLRDRLQASLGVELPVTFIFDHPTIEALAEHLLANVLVLAKEARPRRARGAGRAVQPRHAHERGARVVAGPARAGDRAAAEGPRTPLT